MSAHTPQGLNFQEVKNLIMNKNNEHNPQNKISPDLNMASNFDVKNNPMGHEISVKKENLLGNAHIMIGGSTAHSQRVQHHDGTISTVSEIEDLFSILKMYSDEEKL